jgi:chorismate synthase
MPITVFGASHDPEIGITIHNFPKGIAIDFDLIRAFLRRRTAQRLGASSRHEQEHLK